MDSETDAHASRRGDPLLSGADSMQRSNCGGCVTPPGTTAGLSQVSSNSSPVRSETEYFRELAELLQETMGPSLQRADASELRSMLLQLKEKGSRSNPVQDEGVSSSGSNSLLNPHSLGSMVLEALDGFLFVLNSDAVLDYVSNNADMQHQSIYNFVAPGDSDLFTRLLPEAAEWQMNEFCGARERRSQTFRCTFYASSNNHVNNDAKGDSSERTKVNLHVSAVSLPYPSDAPRDDDHFFNSFAGPSESGACLVCVARRNCGMGQTCPATPSSVPSTSTSQAPSAPVASNNAPPPSLIFGCSPQGQILAFECSNNPSLLSLFPKDFFKTPGSANSLRSLCLQQSDISALNSLLDSASASNYQTLCLRTPYGSCLVTVQARPNHNLNDNYVQLDCTLIDLSSVPPPDSSCPPSATHVTNSSVPPSPRMTPGEDRSPQRMRPPNVASLSSPRLMSPASQVWPPPSPIRPQYDPMSPHNKTGIQSQIGKNTDTLSEICSSIFNDAPCAGPSSCMPPHSYGDTSGRTYTTTNNINNSNSNSVVVNSNPVYQNTNVIKQEVAHNVEFYSPPNADNPYLYHPFSHPEQGAVAAVMMQQRDTNAQVTRGGKAKAKRVRKSAGRGNCGAAGEVGSPPARGRGRKKRGTAGRGASRASPSAMVLPDSSGISGMTSPTQYGQPPQQFVSPSRPNTYPQQGGYPPPQQQIFNNQYQQYAQPQHNMQQMGQEQVLGNDPRYSINPQQLYLIQQQRMMAANLHPATYPPHVRMQANPSAATAGKNQILKELLRPEAAGGSGAGSPCGVSSSGVQPPILSKLLNEADTSSPGGYFPGTTPVASPIQPNSAPGSVAHNGPNSVPSPLNSPAPKRKPSSLSMEGTPSSSGEPSAPNSKSMLVKLLEVPTPGSSMLPTSITTSPFDKMDGKNVMNKPKLDTKYSEHLSRPRPPSQLSLATPPESYNQPGFSPQFPSGPPTYFGDASKGAPPHLLMPSPNLEAMRKQKIGQTPPVITSPTVPSRDPPTPTGYSHPASAPPYPAHEQYMQYSHGFLPQNGPRTASPMGQPAFQFEQAGHPNWNMQRQMQQQMQPGIPQTGPPRFMQPPGYGGWPGSSGQASYNPPSAQDQIHNANPAQQPSSAEMHWLDLGLENGFDMDDENTRNLVQQLLS